ncbi:MAG: acetyl-CoA carboxylase biotin carboxyl carrier protein [Hormoscilla sp.]
MELNFNELRELIAALDGTDIAELTLKGADFELTLRKGTAIGSCYAAAALTETGDAAVTGEQPVRLPAPPRPSDGGVETAPKAIEGARPPATLTDKKWAEIKSPMVGTFYRAPAPGEAPFVQVGDRVNAGQVVCIIEAMKLMNEIEAEVSGKLMEIMVENGEPVDYDKPLMRIDPLA